MKASDLALDIPKLTYYIKASLRLVKDSIDSEINDIDSSMYKELTEVFANINENETPYFKYKINYDIVHVLLQPAIKCYNVREKSLNICSRYCFESSDLGADITKSELKHIEDAMKAEFTGATIDSISCKNAQLRMIIKYPVDITTVLRNSAQILASMYPNGVVSVSDSNTIAIKFND